MGKCEEMDCENCETKNTCLVLKIGIDASKTNVKLNLLYDKIVSREISNQFTLFNELPNVLSEIEIRYLAVVKLDGIFREKLMTQSVLGMLKNSPLIKQAEQEVKKKEIENKIMFS